MGCEASWLGSAHAPLATATRSRPSKRPRSAGASLPCCIHRPVELAARKDRRWYNPDRRRRFRPPEPVRRWVEADSSTSLADYVGERFVMKSYNILGDDNASNHRDLYSNIPFDVMKWDSRKGLICQEISRRNADLVCLQEVDRYYDIMSTLRKEGYAGSFKKRTGEAKDGCAMLWKENRFRLLEEECIQFDAFGLRNNVAQLCVFEMCKAGSRKIVVGNIHVLFNPKRGDIKLGQVRILLWKAHVLSEKWGSIPVVLAGDFNSTPQSAIYEFLSTSELNIALHDRRHLSGQETCQPALFDLPRLLKHCWTDVELKTATGNSDCTQLAHPLQLRSSYASVKGNATTRGPHGEPLATTYHSKFRGTVDYLWFSTGLAPTRVLDTLPIDTLQKTGGLPSKRIGSDHLALVSEFIFTDCRGAEPHDATNTQQPKETTLSQANVS